VQNILFYKDMIVVIFYSSYFVVFFFIKGVLVPEELAEGWWSLCFDEVFCV